MAIVRYNVRIHNGLRHVPSSVVPDQLRMMSGVLMPSNLKNSEHFIHGHALCCFTSTLPKGYCMRRTRVWGSDLDYARTDFVSPVRTRFRPSAAWLLAHRARWSTLETLENRQLLAAVSWDGEAGDNLWHSAANWSTNTVPDAGDDVSLSVAGAPTVLFNTQTGSRTIRSLSSNQSVAFSGGSLAVTTTAIMQAALTMSAGTLAGGSWNVTGGTMTISGTAATLAGVAITGDFSLPSANARVSITGGLTLNGTATLSGFQTALMFVGGNQTLTGANAVVAFEGAGQHFFTAESGAAVTIGPSVTVRGQDAQISSGIFLGGSGTIINQGTILSNINGSTVTINPSTFLNAGIVSVASSARLTLSSPNDVNAGGGYVAASRGILQFSGTLNNTNRTLVLSGSDGFYRMSHGTINGGSLAIIGGAILAADADLANRLVGVSVSGPLLLGDANARLRIEGGTSFTLVRMIGDNTSLAFAPGQTMTGEVLALGPATGARHIEMLATGNLILGPGAIIHAAPGFGGNINIGASFAYAGAMNLVNQGTIASDVPSRVIQISPASFTNQGTIRAFATGRVGVSVAFNNVALVDISGGGRIDATAGFVQSAGSLSLNVGQFVITGTATFNGGTLSGSGTITGNVQNAALLIVGGAAAAGTLTIQGNYSQTPAGALRLELGGLAQGSQYDRLTITGVADLNGTLNVMLINGYFPAVGNTYQPVGFASRTGNVFSTVTGLDIGMSRRLQLTTSATNLTLTTVVSVDTTPPVVTNVVLAATSIQITYFDLGGMNVATVTNRDNYRLVSSGGDGVFGQPNDVNQSARIQFVLYNSVSGVATLSLFPPLADDVYQIVINGQAVRDLAGNPLGADVVAVRTLITTPASVSIDLRADSDSGASSTDNITNDSTPTFDLTVNQSGQINLDFNNDGVAEVIMTAPDAGTYQITAPTLPDGLSRASVRFVPTVGSQAFTFLDFRIDTVAPIALAGVGTAQAPYTQRTIAFSETLDASTFTAQDVLIYRGLIPIGGAQTVFGSADIYTVGFAPLVFPGTYSLRIGPNIRDIAGNAMNNDGDAIPGEPEDLAIDPFTIVPDVGRPTVTAFTPSAPVNTPVSSAMVTFSEWMNPLTFTSTDVTIAGPGGAIPAADITVTGVETMPGSGLFLSFTIQFPAQGLEGEYLVSIGPAIEDIAGNTMAAASMHSFTIDRTGPRVLTISPTQSNTSFSFVDVTFESEILQSTFTAGDVLFMQPGGGVIAITGVARMSPTMYRVSFAPQSSPGAYAIRIGPAISDVAGNLMDQDNDGTPGEPVQDAFVSSISILLPDLIVDSITFPAIVSWGQTLTAEWTVRNAGANPAVTSWLDRVYISTDATLSADDTAIFSVSAGDHVPLAAGAAYTAMRTFTFPSLAIGNFHVLVVADAAFQQPETNESNNVRSLPVTIGAPDLTVTAVNPGPGGVFGQPITVNYTVSNIGSGAAAGSWADQVWLSADGIVDANDFLLTTVPSGATPPLAPGAVYQRSAGVTLPLHASLFSGTYQILVRTNFGGSQPETNFANNVGAASIAIALPPLPDLTVSSIVLPPTAFSNERIEVEWTVRNQGQGVASGTWSDSIYLSSDQVIGNDEFFGSFSFSGVIAAGQSITRRQIIQLPLVYSGLRYAVIQTDSGNTLFEHVNEGNNAAIDDVPISVTLIDFPNLRVTSVTGPATLFSGQTTQVDWVVRNAGLVATAAPIWYDSVYLSLDQTLDGGDLLVGTVSNPNFLNPGESYNNTATVTVPMGISGTRYFIVRTDIFNQVFEHTNESDNVTASSATNVVLTPPPDLEVTNIVAPLLAFSGDTLTLSFTVGNTGPGRTVAFFWSDQVFLSADRTLSADDILMTTLAHSGELQPGGSYSRSATISLPVGLAGDFFFLVRTDASNQVFEAAFENNNVRAEDTPTEIRLTPPPDLEVTSVDAPSAVNTGASIIVSFTVENLGAAPTPNSFWTDAVYLSLDPFLNTGADALLGERAHSGALDAGDGYTQSFSFTVPPVPSGAYYVLVFTDNRNVVYELNNVNNVAASDSTLEVTLVTSPPPPPPPPPPPAMPADLVLSGVAVPAAGESGRSINVDWTVTNSGIGATNSSFWYDYVVLSADSTPSQGDVVLMSASRSGTLNVGGSYARTNLPVLIPLSTAPGDYFLFLITDAVNSVGETAAGELNNASAAFPISITRRAADLAVTSVDAPPAAASGSSINITWSVENSGEVRTSSEAWYDDVYLSSDTDIGPGDLLLGRIYRSSGLNPGESYTASGVFTIPIDFAGAYRTLIRTDSQDQVFEGSNPRRNDAAAPDPIDIALSPVADLAVANVENPPSSVSGQLVTFEWSVENIGGAPANGSWFDAVYLSLDQVFDRSSDVLLGTQQRSAPLAIGASYAASAILRVPAGLSGPYYVFISTDGGNSIYERLAELNNTGYSSAPVVLTLAAPADLVPGTITIPPDSSPGQTTTVSYTVSNQGSNAALGSWSDSIYVSSDSTWDISDQLLGRFDHYGDIAPGASYTGAVTAPLPGVLPGDYHLIVRSDVRNTVPELDESNNASASSDVFTLTPATLTVNVPSAGSLAGGQSVFYQITVEEGETLLISFDSQSMSASNELFLAHERMPRRSDFDFSFSSAFAPDQEVVVPVTRAGTYFVLAYGNDNSPASTYSITASLLPFGIRRLGLSTISNAGRVTIPIEGAQLQLDTTFRLHSASVQRSPVDVRFESTARAFATFDTTGLPAGQYTLDAERNGITSVAPVPITVVTEQQGIITGRVEGPGTLRLGAMDIMQVSFGNSGLSDVYMPLVRVFSPAGTPVARLGESPRPQTLYLMPISPDGPSNVLRPGQQMSIPLEFRAATADAGFNVDFVLPTDPNPFNINTLFPRLRPAGLSDAAWNAAVATLLARIDGRDAIPGPTVGELVRFLGESTREYAAANRDAVDPSDILADQVRDVLGLGGGIIEAQIIDAQSGRPLSGVLTQLAVVSSPTLEPGLLRTVVSDETGRFGLAQLPDGTYSLQPVSAALESPVIVTIAQGVSPPPVVLRAIVLFEDADFGPRAGGNTFADGDREGYRLADHAYLTDSQVELSGYETLRVIEGTNGFAVWVLRRENSTNDLAFAFRGTQPSKVTLRDLLTDFTLARRQWYTSGGQSNAAEVIELARDWHQANPDARITFSGHSLGGALAQFAAYELANLEFGIPRHLLAVYSYNGLGGVEGIRQQYGSYDASRANGVLARHWMHESDIVARLGNGHFGSNPTRIGPAIANIFNAHDRQFFEDAFGRTGPSLPASGYLGVDFSQRLAAFVGEFGNAFPDDSTFESVLRIIAVLSITSADVLNNPIAAAEFARVMDFVLDNLSRASGWTPEMVSVIRNGTIIPALRAVSSSPQLQRTLTRYALVAGVSATVGAVIVDLVDGVASAVHRFFTETLPDFIADTQQFITEQVDAIVGAIQRGWNNVVETVERVTALLEQMIDGVTERITTFVNNALDTASQLAQDAADFLRSAADAFRDWIQGIFDDAVRWINDRLNDLRELADRIRDGLEDFFDDLRDFFDPSPYFPIIRIAVDPNDIIGPLGFGEQRWVTASENLEYTIRFENDPALANAPAQIVRITQQLDPDLDFRTFRVGDFGFGDVVIDVPDNRAFYQNRLDLRDERGIFLDVAAGIDILTGEAFWQFTSIDPVTGEPPRDPDAGFLPPNLESPEGEGFARYAVRASRNAPSGSVIDATARIVFDINEPIDTPPVFNTLDSGRPNSQVLPLPAQSADTALMVRWTGADAPQGSGLASYTIYVKTDDGPYQPWLADTTLSEAIFPAELGHRYAFYSIARDFAGNIENAPPTADAAILVDFASVGQVMVDDGTAQRSQVRGLTITFTAPVVLDADAVTLARFGAPDVVLDITNPSGDGRAYLVSFSGAAVEFGSLIDGNYRLVVHADRVHDLLGRPLGGGDFGLTLFRLFGDSDGDRDVDALDLSRLRGSLGAQSGDLNYFSYFDFDADGDVDGADFQQGRSRLGVRLLDPFVESPPGRVPLEPVAVLFDFFEHAPAGTDAQRPLPPG